MYAFNALSYINDMITWAFVTTVKLFIDLNMKIWREKNFSFFHFDLLIPPSDESFWSYLFCCQKSLGNQFKCIFLNFIYFHVDAGCYSNYLSIMPPFIVVVILYCNGYCQPIPYGRLLLLFVVWLLNCSIVTAQRAQSSFLLGHSPIQLYCHCAWTRAKEIVCKEKQNERNHFARLGRFFTFSFVWNSN